MSINAGDESYTPREGALVAKSQMPAACISLRQGILKTVSYTTEGMNLIDFFSVLPFYLRLILSAIADKSTGSGLDFLLAARILRMIRVFRVIRAGKSSEGLAMFGEVFKSSFPALKIIFFFVILSMIIFGCVIFEVEKGEWKVHEACPHGGGCYIRFNFAIFEEERSPFTSIPAAFWWVIVTQTTVGYGDLYPTSVAGKFTAFVVMLFGIINFALPITVLGANFADVYAKEEKLNDLFESEQEQIEFENDEMMEDDDSTSIDRRMSRKDSNLSSSHRATLARRQTGQSLQSLRSESLAGADIRRGKSKRVHPEYNSLLYHDSLRGGETIHEKPHIHENPHGVTNIRRVVHARIIAKRALASHRKAKSAS